MYRPLAALIATALVAGCASPTTAPIVQRGADPGHTAQIVTVQRGDTAAGLAARLGVSVEELLAANGLPRGSEVRAGQILRVVPATDPSVARADFPPGAQARPAPIESGAARPPAATQPRADAALPPPAGVAPPGSAVAPPPAGGGVQLGAVREGEAMGRPLVSDQLKTGPKGLKRPYSDATLAELSRSDDAAGGARAGVVRPPPTGGVAVPGGSGGGGMARGDTRPADEIRAPAGAPTPVAPDATTAADASTWTWPGAGRVVQPFEEGKSKGIVLGGKLGDPVLAAADGRVIFSGPGPRGYGNLVIIKHANDLLSVYAHNRAVLVKEGATVKRGQRIAELGDSDADRPKLHFEVRRQGKPVDPVGVLPPR